MKIVLSDDRFYPPKWGGVLSMLTLLEELAKKHEIEAFYLGEKTGVSEHNGIVLNTIKSGIESCKSFGFYRMFLIRKKWRLFEDYLKDKKPDLILTQGDLIPASVEIALKHNIKSSAFIRNYSFMCISAFVGVEKAETHNCLAHASLKKIIQYPAFKKFFEWHRNFLKKTFVVSNSEFTRILVKNFCGADSPVIYPAVDYKNYKAKHRNPKYITFLRPKIHKGVDIFLKIADSMPEKEFLVVGDTDRLKDLKARKNVRYVPWTADVKRFYAQTKVLLIPSIWHEPFSRVSLEAMCNGIPCIASNRGGLPEAVGNAGIVIKNLFDIKSWVNAINKLEDEELYRKLSKRSENRSKKFDFKKQYKKFEEVIEKLGE
jgi:glycosyltransferase involved in cell wall biosynthesis